MKKLTLLLIFGGLTFTALSGLTVMAQNTVVNPLFQTGDMQYWDGSDSSLAVLVGPATLGMDYYCLRKFPGNPSNNGAVTQQVHLIGGTNYKFQANIASKYCST